MPETAAFTIDHPAFTLAVPPGFMDGTSPVCILGPERDGFRANVATFSVVSPGDDFESFFAKCTVEVASLRGGRVIESGEELRDGVRYGRLVYRYRHEGNLLRVASLFAARGGVFHRILYTAPDADFDRLLPLAERMLGSFRIK